MSRFSLVPLVLLGAALGACADRIEPTGVPRDPAPPTFATTAAATDPTPSQDAVAQAVPGFGGYYVDAAGRPTVWLTDAAQRPAAEAALAAFLDSYGWTAADLQVREARYGWLELSGWYAAVRPTALAAAGAVFGDVDEATNRIALAGLDASALTRLADAVAAANVPSDAVTLTLAAPVVQTATLRDRIRPPLGGLQINFFASPASPVGYLCTIGFNAIDGTDTSFVTNSHCGNVQGGTTLPTDFYQATRGLVADPANFIAREVEDPDYTLGGPEGACPPGRRCRYSDASRAKYQGGFPFALGKLARAQNENATGTLADTIAIDSLNPTWTITAEQERSVVGQKLAHVGRTTGWTSGPVLRTCVDVNISASEITQLCQDFVDAHVAGGDSGSPMFGEHTDGTAFLAGILWGSSTNLTTGKAQIIMSPFAAIEQELGELKTFDPPPPAPEPTKPRKKKNKG